MLEVENTRAFASNDPNLTPEQKKLAEATQRVLLTLSPVVKLVVRNMVDDDPALAINAMCSALAHEIADTFAIAVVVHGADDAQVRKLIGGYQEGIRRGFDVQLEAHKARYAEFLASAEVQRQ